VRPAAFFAAAIGAAILAFVVALLVGNDYLFFAGYTVVQFIVLASAWNILGGYCGYVNFGTAGFFALGAYTAVFFHKTYPLPIPVLLIIAAGVSGLIGFGAGYLTLRLRGALRKAVRISVAVEIPNLTMDILWLRWGSDKTNDSVDLNIAGPNEFSNESTHIWGAIDNSFRASCSRVLAFRTFKGAAAHT
jgi:ABC-type branched-subunit amino acid transport system permease subunit